MTRPTAPPGRTIGRLPRPLPTALALVLAAAGCAPDHPPRPGTNAATPAAEGAAPPKPRAPIEIDLGALDADGLRGPADGKVAVAYEFTIPDTPEARARVRAIDATVEFQPGSRGRVGAGEGECLCIGSTHQPDFRAVLEALASLPDVGRIVECHLE